MVAHPVTFPSSPGTIVDEGLPKQLLTFCQEIADGMRYLSRRGFVHRDLAARNILLSKGLSCKVGALDATDCASTWHRVLCDLRRNGASEVDCARGVYSYINTVAACARLHTFACTLYTICVQEKWPLTKCSLSMECALCELHSKVYQQNSQRKDW